MYKRKRFQPQEDQWPPDQPKAIVDLALVHLKGQQSQQEFIEMSKNKDSVSYSNYSRMTKKICEVLSSESRILIEGAPGIGKTVLAKEIAYCWANGELSVGKKLNLFLLFIRDSDLHSVDSIDTLLQYLGNSYLSDSEVKVVTERLKKVKGLNAVFVFDGYDECPCNSKLKEFIDKLYKGELLQQSTVIITSRSTASLKLRELAGQRIEILGLAKKEQNQYISESLEGSPEKITKLQEYLKNQPTISSLTYFPLHLAVLLYLFKHNMLPKTLTEMNEYFIIHTIYRHLVRDGKQQPITIDRVTDIPEPELSIVYKLSKLAYNGLQNSKLIFTYDEIKQICPEVDDTPGAINGFGILQAVEHYYHKGAGAGRTTSVNFLHLTMQEYLAALYISTLSNEKQSLKLKWHFWDNQFNNMWIMYTGIMGSQSSCFAEIAHSVLSSGIPDKRRILFIFQCYLEIKDLTTIPQEITSTFSDGKIDFSEVTLLPHQVMSLVIFMMKSSTEWKSLNLSKCSIGNKGVSYITKFFNDFKEKLTSTIQFVNLSNNKLNSLWGTLTDMNEDNITETALLLVEYIDLSCNEFDKGGTMQIFSALHLNKFLRKLNLSQNNISVQATVTISECLKNNKALEHLDISINNIMDEGAKALAEGILGNKTLRELNISKNWISKIGVMMIVQACTKNRMLCKLVCTHNNLSESGLKAIDECIEEEKALQTFEASWNSISTTYNDLTIEILYVQSHSNMNQNEVWNMDEITKSGFKTEFLSCCWEEYFNGPSLEVILKQLKLKDFDIEIVSKFFNMNKTLHTVNLSVNFITDEGVKYLAEAIKRNTTLQYLDISKNLISKEGVKSILEACAKNRTLHELVCTHNNLSKPELVDISEYVRKEQAVKIFHASWNCICAETGHITIKTIFEILNLALNPSAHDNDQNLQYDRWRISKIEELEYKKKFLQCCFESEQTVNLQGITGSYDFETFQYIEMISDCLKSNNTLTELSLSNNKITSKGALKLAEAIKVNTKLQTFDISYNHLHDGNGILLISDSLKVNKTLCELNLSGNMIDINGMKNLAEVISVNATLKKLDISSSNISNDGLSYFCDHLKNNKALKELNLSKNMITDEEMVKFAIAIQGNVTLQVLNISKNWISKVGIKQILEACTKNKTLCKLICTHNNLSKSEFLSINEYVRKENAVQTFDASWNSIASDHGVLAIETTLHSLDLQQNVQTADNMNYKGQINLWYVDTITEEKYRTEFLRCCFQEYFNEQNVIILQNVHINSFVFEIFSELLKINITVTDLNLAGCHYFHDSYNIAKCLTINSTVCKLNLSKNYITDSDIEEAFSINTTLQQINLSDNSISDHGIIFICDCLEINDTLRELDLCRNEITDEGAKRLALAMEVNRTLKELNISKNWFSKQGVMGIVEACAKNKTLYKLVCRYSCLTKAELKDINEYIIKENAVQIFDASYSEVKENAAQKVLFDEFYSKGEDCGNTSYGETPILDKSIAIKTTIKILYAKQKRQSDNLDDIQQTEWPPYSLYHKQSRKFICHCFEEYLNNPMVRLRPSCMDDDFAKIISDSLKINNVLTELSLSRCRITDEHVKVLTEAIKVNITIQNIDISHNQITDKGAISISECLKINKALYYMNLSGNQITDSGIKTLTEAIIVNDTLQLQSLDLSHNELSDDCTVFLSNCLNVNKKFKKLNLSGNRITDIGAKRLAEAIQVNKTLSELSISKTWISKEGVMRILEACTKNRVLYKLVCVHNNVSEHGFAAIIKYIKEENAVQIFDASWNSIGTKNYRLAIKTTYQTFTIKGNNQRQCHENDSILWCLDEYSSKEIDLRWEFLECCFESERSVKLQGITINRTEFEIISNCLEVNDTLSELTLSNNKITNEDAGRLFKAVKETLTLQTFDLSHNRITDDGLLAIYDCLIVNNTLRKLNLSKNNFTNKGISKLAEGIQVNTTIQELNISGNQINKEGVMKIVEACAINRTLHKLVCTHNNLSKPGLAGINEYIRNANAVQLFDASWDSVYIDTKNHKLAIKTISQLFDKEKPIHLDSESSCTQEELRCMYEVNETEYKKELLCYFFESYLNAKILCLQSIRLSTTEIEILSDYIQNLQNDDCLQIEILQELNLSGSYIGNNGVRILAEAVTVNRSIQRLDLSSNQIADDGVFYVSSSLKLNKSLCVLILSDNLITDKGAETLANAIEINDSLQELNVSKNVISKKGVMKILKACTIKRTLHKMVCICNDLSKSGLRAINEYIKNEKPVNIFDASWNTISAKDGVLTIKTIPHVVQRSQANDEIQSCYDYDHTFVKKSPKFSDYFTKEYEDYQIYFEEYLNEPIVNLQDIRMDNSTIALLSECLKNNEILTDLNLSNYKIDYTYIHYVGTGFVKYLDDISAISSCLKINNTLCKLNLSGNSITDEGAEELADAIQVNEALKKLNVSKNDITDKGVQELAVAIQVNKALQKLNVSKNQISNDGVMRIVKACTKSVTLHKLVCTHNYLIKPRLSEINDYVKEKKVLQVFKASWGSIYPKNGKINIKTTIQVLQLNNRKVYDELSYEDGIHESQAKDEFLLYCKYYLNVHHSLSLRDVAIKDFEAKVLCQYLESNETITNLSLSMIHIEHPNDGSSIIQTVDPNGNLSMSIIREEYSNGTFRTYIDHFNVTTLFRAAAANTTLQKLDISCNAICDKMVPLITNSLKSNKTLQKLNLSQNSISDIGAESLAEIIQVNTTLQEMDVSKNWIITKKGIMKILEACIINKTLHKLVCTHNNIWKSGLMQIDEYNKKENAVDVLEASWNSICTIKHKLAIETTLKFLKLDNNNYTTKKELWFLDEIAKQRSQFLYCWFKEYVKELNVLNFGLLDARIDDCEIEILACSCSQTNNLELRFSISDRCEHNMLGSRYFQINNTCIPLTLSTCYIFSYWLTCSSTAKITINTALLKLDLSHHMISDDGILFICSCLKINKTLQELNLSRTGITDKGAEELAKAIQLNNTLQRLNISSNMISKEGVMKLLEACTKHKVLHELVCVDINLTKCGLNDINKYIKNENAVQFFKSSWNSMHIDEINNELIIKTNYQFLDAGKSEIDANVNKSEMEETECALWNMYMDMDEKIILINYQKELLYCCFKEYLNNQIVSLQNVRMTKFEIDAFTECLKINDILIELNLSGCLMHNNDLNLVLNTTRIISNFLKKNSTLRLLDCSSNHITDDGAAALAEAIQVNTTIKELDISKNFISKEGVMNIVKSCTRNRKLSKLICTHNNLSKAGLGTINEYIRKENAVKIFNASWNSICTKYGELAIKTKFQLQSDSTNSNIMEDWWYMDEITVKKYKKEFLLCCLDSEQSVNLHGIRMTDSFEVEVISSYLKSNSMLSELTLSNNRIDDQGAIMLVKAIYTEKNETLQNLDISNNIITDDALFAIRDCLVNNNALCKLNLSKNQITDEGAKRLAKGIRNNTTLQELNISKNLISKEGIMRILEACTKTKTLCKLISTHNNLTKSGLDSIMQKIAIKTFYVSWNSIVIKHSKLAIKTTFQILDTNQSKVQPDERDIPEELWYMHEIPKTECMKKAIYCCLESEQQLDIQGLRVTDYFEIELISDYLKTNTSLTEVKLSNNAITDNFGLEKLAKAIELNKTLENLDISKNEISEVEELAKAIEVNMTLQNLDISSNMISDNGISVLCDCLRNNCILCKLNLSSNFITDEGATILADGIQANTSLKELIISKNWIGKNGIMRILEACANDRPLYRLDCSCNDISVSELTAINMYTRETNSVQSFHASWNNCIIKSDYESMLYVLVMFQSLMMLPDGDWEAKLSKGHELWLVDNMLWKDHNNSCSFAHGSLIEWKCNMFQSFEIIDTIALAALQKFEIYSSIMDFDAMSALAKYIKTNSSLIELNISNCAITCENACAIANAILIANILQKLDISDNEISDDGAAALSKYLESSTSLRELDISWNDITYKGANTIAEALKNNKTLQKLDISGNKIFDDVIITFSECLKNNITLMELSMSKTNITIKGTCALQVNSTLKKLDISGNEICDNGAIALSKYLECSTSLRELDVSGNNITYKGANAIAEALKGNKTLQKLDISGNRISDDVIITFSESLKYNTTLMELSISRTNITTKGNCVLQINSTLKKLDISDNDICDDGAITLSECLKTNVELIELDISWNKIGCKGASAIAKAIQVNIACNKRSNSKITSFSECLKGNQHKNSRNSVKEVKQIKGLQKLNVSGNKISNDGGIAFGECLKTNASLIEFDISNNKIACKGASVIARALQENTTLRMLNILLNNITADGVIAFSECLKTNKTLTEFHLSTDFFTSKEANAIVKAIETNVDLKSLTLYIANINASSCTQRFSFNMTILAALYNNNMITELTLSKPILPLDVDIIENEIEKLNNKRRKQIPTATLIKFYWIID